MAVREFWNIARRKYLSNALRNLFLLLIGALGTTEIIKASFWLKLVLGISAVGSIIMGTFICPKEGAD